MKVIIKNKKQTFLQNHSTFSAFLLFFFCISPVENVSFVLEAQDFPRRIIGSTLLVFSSTPKIIDFVASILVKTDCMFLSCQSESTLYSCLNVKVLLARTRCEIWSLTQVWPNGWLFFYELIGSGFGSSFD